MRQLSLAFACLGLALLQGCGVSLADDGHSLTGVNGNVNAAPGSSYVNVSSVNGDVRLGRGATASVAKTVNGEIRLEEEARVGEATTVNGSVRAAPGVQITHDARAVNGNIEISERARVGGNVTTANGSIEIDGGEVTGLITTRNGNIELRSGARVLGGIHVLEETNSHNWNRNDPPRVDIGENCVVEGTLRFDREVELKVHPSAKIGQVIGDKVRRL
jgi:DUF4097 and DUF4098 domain-containing protein YvlB